MTKAPRPSRAVSRPRPARLYRLAVSILSGPVTERFARANPVVATPIEIRGDQTLARLHAAIFNAFA